MPLSNIRPESLIDPILVDNAYTQGELVSHPLSLPFLPQFEAFQTKATATSTARLTLLVNIGKANGYVAAADDDIDTFLDKLDLTVKGLQEKDVLHPFYFPKPLHQMKRPVLGTELEAAKAILEKLNKAPQPALAALAPELATLIATADKRVEELLAAEQALKSFDVVGEKKTLIDDYNLLRQTVYGQLAAMPHSATGKGLPSNFADRFFRHLTRKDISGAANLEEAKARVDALKQELMEAEGHLAAAEAAAKAKEEAKKAQAEADAKAEEAKKTAELAAKALKEAQKAASEARKLAKK